MSLYQVPENIKTANDLTAKLEHLKNIKRSFSVYRIDCGSCNGCEIEIFAAITPMWDPERFGFKLVANPRHADILVCSGPVTRQMYYPSTPSKRYLWSWHGSWYHRSKAAKKKLRAGRLQGSGC